MSTKTTFKRIALVAVAALGLGVLSVAPSTAAINNDSLTLSAATASQTTAETSTATSATVSVAFLASATSDSVTVTASLVSGPATSTALPYLELVDTASASLNNVNQVAGFSIAPNTGAIVKSTVSTATVIKAKFKVFLAKGDTTTAPSVAGTYVVKLTPTSAAALNGTAQTLTITVTEDAGLATAASPSLTTSIINSGETVSATVDAVVAAAKTVATTAAATIVVTQLNAAGKGLATSPASAGESLTVIVTGPGSIVAVPKSELDGADTAKHADLTGARAITLKNGDAVAVYADGSAGTSTITFTNAAGTVIATETVTFYSTVVAKLTAKTIKSYVLAGGTATDGSSAATATNTNSRVFLVNAVDADGRDMASGAGTITVTPTSTTTDALIGATGACTYAEKTTLTAAGYYCSAPGVSAAKFGKVNYTFAATLADGTTKVTTTADVTFSDKEIASFTITGPATASVGQEVTLTFTAKDKNGYPVADLSYEGAATNGRTLWEETSYSNANFAPFGVGETITTVSGVATKKLYVPATAGTVKATWTTTGTAGVASGALAKTLTETDVVFSLTVASEALDAANAATTAALAANDAVDALAATVAKLVANLKAQITALTKLIVKIQKKVGA